MSNLALTSRVMAAASMTAKRIGDSPFLINQNLSATDEGRASFDVIDAARRKYGVAQDTLAREAGLSLPTYTRLLKRRALPRTSHITRLADAMRRIIRRQTLDNVALTSLMEATYGGFLVAVCAEFKLSVEAVRQADPRAGHTADKHWRACAHARQAAVYLTHTSLGVPQRAIARTVGLTEAAVCLAIQSVEARRDDPDFDRLLDRVSSDVTGRLLP